MIQNSPEEEVMKAETLQALKVVSSNYSLASTCAHPVFGTFLAHGICLNFLNLEVLSIPAVYGIPAGG